MKKTALKLAIAAGVAGCALLPTAAANADYGHPPTTVTTTAGGNGGGGATTTSPNAGTTNGGGSGSLPFTGGDVVGLALVGSGMLAGGTAFVRASRRGRR